MFALGFQRNIDRQIAFFFTMPINRMMPISDSTVF